MSSDNIFILKCIFGLRSLLLYLLLEYPEESFEKLKSSIDLEIIKSEFNRNIIERLYIGGGHVLNKKKLIFLLVLFGVLFSVQNTKALTVSEYKSRTTCKSKFELARANSNGSVTSVKCYNTYAEANTAMNSSSYDDVFIFDETGTTKIVNAKYALVDLSVNPETLTYYYETKDLSGRKYTYMDNGSLYGGVDGALLDVNYNKSIKYIEIYCNGILLGTLFITNYYLSKLNIKKKSIFLNNNNSFFFENNYIEILF